MIDESSVLAGAESRICAAFEVHKQKIRDAHTRYRKDGTARRLSDDAQCRLVRADAYRDIALAAVWGQDK